MLDLVDKLRYFTWLAKATEKSRMRGLVKEKLNLRKFAGAERGEKSAVRNNPWPHFHVNSNTLKLGKMIF